MRQLKITFLLLFSANILLCQNLEFAREICAEEQKHNIETLRDSFGTNKEYPETEELQILLALSFYPELKATDIEFRYAILECSLQARPKYYSLLRSRSGRKYVILINEDQESPVHPSKSGFAAQVGFFTHELAHIVDYETMTKRKLVATAWKYNMNPEFKKNLEQKTDMIAIEHGAGYLKYHASCFIFYESEASEKYLEKKKRFYFSPEEILERTNWAERIFLEK